MGGIALEHADEIGTGVEIAALHVSVAGGWQVEGGVAVYLRLLSLLLLGVVH